LSESPGFSDLFSRQAAVYAAARPTYPPELYDLVAGLAPGRSLAWDCATGNGQAARDLARHFDRVVATDASAEQIRHAAPAANVEYRVATAEDSGLAPGSIELTTVAQALHWLDHGRFYAEVRRVTVPHGILAAWCYGSCHAGAELEPALREFEDGLLGPYWNPERRWVDEGYRTIPFPFPDIPMPTLELRVTWSLSQLGEYLSSWSAVDRFRRERGVDPVAPFLEHIVKLWGPPGRTRTVVWPLGLRVGRVG
jgi:SAM-dependent methyltransferase